MPKKEFEICPWAATGTRQEAISKKKIAKINSHLVQTFIVIFLLSKMLRRPDAKMRHPGRQKI
jgi:hypothetical protein